MKRGSLERIDDRFGIVHCRRRIEWPAVYDLLEELNSHTREKVKLISFDGARDFPYSDRVAAHYDFPVDGLVAYERTDIDLAFEIVNDPYSVMDAFSVQQNKMIQIEHNKGEGKVIVRTGKFAGRRNIALLALGLRKADFEIRGKDVFVSISDERMIGVDVEIGFPDDRVFIPPAKNLVFKWSETDRYAGPILVYRNNYDMSFSFGATGSHSRLPAFESLAVEIAQS